MASRSAAERSGGFILALRVVEADVLFGEQEMMRRDFAGDAQSVAARLAHGSHGSGRGGVGHVQMHAGHRAAR